MTSRAAPSVSVIIPAKDAAATLPETLSRLGRQDLSDTFEVIVVDDGSIDVTRDVIEASPLPAILVEGPGDGAGPARNAGVSASRAPLLAFTDSDCFPDTRWLSAGVRRLRAGAELVQGRVVPAADDPGGAFSRRFWVSRDTGLHETANLFVTREAFDRVDGFKPLVDHLIRGKKGRPMGEDTWFGWRLRRTGVALEFATEAVVEHEVLFRGGRDYVRERLRDGHFAHLAAQIPELRSTLFFGRVFLSRRSAAFDAALVATTLAVTKRRAWPLAAVLPYLAIVGKEVWPWPGERLRLAAIHAAGDAVGLGSLLTGNARTRSPVL